MTDEQRTIAELRRQVAELEEALEARDASLARRFEELGQLTARLESQREELERLRVTWKPLRWFRQNREPNPFPVAPWYRRWFRRVRRRIPRRAVSVIAESPLFDAEWYLAQYPELAKRGGVLHNPALHYLKQGGFEGRNPSPHFDSDWYLRRYTDVEAIGVNPLLHYILYGMDEGRQPRPPGA